MIGLLQSDICVTRPGHTVTKKAPPECSEAGERRVKSQIIESSGIPLELPPLVSSDISRRG